MVCPNCGKELKNDDLFCSKCGTKRDAKESEPVFSSCLDGSRERFSRILKFFLSRKREQRSLKYCSVIGKALPSLKSMAGSCDIR